MQKSTFACVLALSLCMVANARPEEHASQGDPKITQPDKITPVQAIPGVPLLAASTPAKPDSATSNKVPGTHDIPATGVPAQSTTKPIESNGTKPAEHDGAKPEEHGGPKPAEHGGPKPAEHDATKPADGTKPSENNGTKPADPMTLKPTEPTKDKTTPLMPTQAPSFAPTAAPTKAPVSTTEHAKIVSTSATPVMGARGFDGASFIGGIVLALGLLAIGFMGFKYYKTQTERNYHTL